MEHSAAEHHHPSYGSYVMIWMALLILTGLTVAAAGINMGALNTPVAMLIASVKCTLVILYFMHMKYEAPLFKLMLVLCLFTLAIIIGISLFDYDFRM